MRNPGKNMRFEENSEINRLQKNLKRTEICLDLENKKIRNKSDTQTQRTPGGYLGHHTNPSDFKLNHKSEQVIAEVKKLSQAFPGSNCIEVTGYGKDSDVVLANKILEKKKKKAEKDQLKAKQKQQWSNIQKKNSKKLICQKQNAIHVYV